MTSKEIVTALSYYFDRRKNYVVPGFGGLPHTSDCDLLVVRPSGWAEEVEIKISKADFKREFEKKQYKHRVLVKGIPKHIYKPYVGSMNLESIEEWNQAVISPTFEPVSYYYAAKERTLQTCCFGHDWGQCQPVPLKKFWFAMPSELAEELKDQIPPYAGLLTIGQYSTVMQVAQAPTLKGRKLTPEEIQKVFVSIYHRYWDRKEAS